jgi:predicted dehydrogenase
MFDDTLSEGKLRHVDQGEDSRIGLQAYESKELYYRPGELRIPQLAEDEPLHIECAHFIECVRTNTPPRADGRIGAVVVRLLEAANESITRGNTPVRLTWDEIPSGMLSELNFVPAGEGIG